MKRLSLILILACTLLALSSCKSTSNTSKKIINTEIVENYFFSNDSETEAEFVINDEKTFNNLFSPAAVMGENGMPTKINFKKQSAVCVVLPLTDIFTRLDFIELTSNEDKSLTFNYRMTLGSKQSYVMRPILIVAVDKKYLKNGINFHRVFVR